MTLKDCGERPKGPLEPVAATSLGIQIALAKTKIPPAPIAMGGTSDKASYFFAPFSR